MINIWNEFMCVVHWRLFHDLNCFFHFDLLIRKWFLGLYKFFCYFFIVAGFLRKGKQYVFDWEKSQNTGERTRLDDPNLSIFAHSLFQILFETIHVMILWHFVNVYWMYPECYLSGIPSVYVTRVDTSFRWSSPRHPDSLITSTTTWTILMISFTRIIILFFILKC